MSHGSPLIPEHHRVQPTLHSPYEEPDRHWRRTADEKDTVNEILSGRLSVRRVQPSSPVLQAPMQALLTEDSDGQVDNALLVERLRRLVRDWSHAGWRGTTSATRSLLEYWSRPPGEGPRYSPFWAQREAVETIVYLTEVAAHDSSELRELRECARRWSRDLMRLAISMATGTGKTRVMAMLIAWYAVNRGREHRAAGAGLARNVGRIVVIAPGRTIARQLQMLVPSRRNNIYTTDRLAPDHLLKRIDGMRVHVLNFEKLVPRRGTGLLGVEGVTTKAKAFADAEEIAEEVESYDAMWTRLLQNPRSNGRPERIVVINDEGHHCWERSDAAKAKPGGTGIWMEAVHALERHLRFTVAQAIDVTATPFFIDPPNTHRPPGEKLPVGEPLFPWIVSEFPLDEAMETGLVTIPRRPKGPDGVVDDELETLYETSQGNFYDNPHVAERVTRAARMLYQDYERQFRKWEKDNAAATGPRSAHPVMIAVVNNRRNAQKLHEILGGSPRDPDAQHYDPPIGFDLLSNVPRRGATSTQCEQAPSRTIVVYSPGGGEASRSEGSLFTNGRIGVREAKNSEQVEEILATVARPGKAGADVRCVISVGMLTEGWDCPFVTNILGFRKFGSELLARQTMGRALRRWDYDTVIPSPRQDTGATTNRFPAQYTTVIGVPFGEHLHTDDESAEGTFRPPSTVRPVEERRTTHRISVPRFTDYVFDYQEPRIRLVPERVQPARRDLLPGSAEPSATTFRAPIGEQLHVTEELIAHGSTGIWKLAAEAAASIGRKRQKEGNGHLLEHGSDLFSQCLRIVREWLRHDQVDVDEIYLQGLANRERLLDPLLSAIDTTGKTGLQRIGRPLDLNMVHASAGDWHPFETRLEHIIETKRSELNLAACHNRFETQIAAALDRHPRIDAFVRNHGPERFEIPYRRGGDWAKYVPDFFARTAFRAGSDGQTRHVHLIVEGKGPLDPYAEAKARWTTNWWCPAADAAAAAEGRCRVRWGYLEVRSLEGIQNLIDHALTQLETN